MSCVISDERNNILLKIPAQKQNLEGLKAFVFFRLNNTKMDFSWDASNVLSQSQTEEIRAHPEEGIGQHRIPWTIPAHYTSPWVLGEVTSFLPSSFILSPQLLGGTVVLQLEVNLTNVQWIRVKREGSLQLKTGIASWEQIIHLTSTRTLTLRSSACSRGTNCCEQRTLQSRLVGESSLNSCGEWLVYVLKWWYKTPSFRVSAILHQDCCSHLTQGADLP